VSIADARVPETVLIRLDPAAGSDGQAGWMQALEPLLVHVNWRAHFYLVSAVEPGPSEGMRAIIDRLARFVLANPLVTFLVHPLVGIGRSEAAASAQCTALLDCLWPLQQQAYQQQGEARLQILPIIEPEPGTADADWLKVAQHCHARLAPPSVLLRGPAGLRQARSAAGRGIRFYLESAVDSGAAGALRQLGMSRVFEDLLERVKGAGSALGGGVDAGLLAPCRSHLVVDQCTGGAYACYRDWSSDRRFAALEAGPAWVARIADRCQPQACAECISQSASSMTNSLIANDRQSEGSQAHLQLALTFAGSKQHREALVHAGRAHELATEDAARAAALVCQGLCQLALREFEPADQTLQEAARCSDDPGLVSYQRGRVQFEWRDYITAIEHFEQALASGSTAVPVGDLCFHLAASHIQIGEYAQARPYLERWRASGWRRAVMLYYSGLCDVGEERLESALSEFRAAEQAEPPREDLGAVLCYTGFCLKELGRYAEAIGVLERAVVVDPDEIGIHSLLGYCYYKAARPAEAVRCFQRAVQLDPRSAIDYASLASNLRDLGRTDEAIATYRKALSLDPSIGFARENLQRLLDQRGEPGAPGGAESC
jgi:tetratricopeptide (TPR) repeat protein